jgi:hypothetical protein
MWLDFGRILMSLKDFPDEMSIKCEDEVGMKANVYIYIFLQRN